MNTDKQTLSLTEEEIILDSIIEKIQEKYVGVDLKITPNKELIIQIVGDEEYFQSTQKDIGNIVRSNIKDSILNDYIIFYQRWNTNNEAIEFNKKMEMNQVLLAIMHDLSDYEEHIQDIRFDFQQSVFIIQTSINSSDKDAQNIAMGIEQKVHDIITSDFHTLSIIDSYNIRILNDKGIKLNNTKS